VQMIMMALANCAPCEIL